MSQGRASARLAPAAADAVRIRLKRSVHAAPVGDDLVLLDVEGDRYLCLPAARRQAKLGSDRRTLHAAPALAQALPASLQELSPEPAPGPDAGPPPLPVSDLAHQAAPRITARHGLRLALCYLDYLRLCVGRPFAQILANVRHGERAASAGSAAEAAAIFARLVVWLPVSGTCLVRSFLLMRFILRSGAQAQWVFGVRTWPFGAHCWVQQDAIVLDDYAQAVAAYTPLMAV